MADYEEFLTNDVTGERFCLKSNDHSTFLLKKEKKLDSWRKQNHKLLNTREADQRTLEVKSEVKAYKQLLAATLSVDDRINWGELTKKQQYFPFKPEEKPDRTEFFASVRKKSFLDFIPSVKRYRLAEEDEAQKKYEAALSEHDQNEAKRLKKYEKARDVFLKEQETHNGEIEDCKLNYENGTVEGVEKYISLVLERSKYPDSLILCPEAVYEANSKTLLINMDLPGNDSVPNVVEFKFLAAKGEISKKLMGKKEFEEFYNDTLYQIALRTIHEICECDYQKHIETVVFNGWVEGVDAKTGQDSRNCVMSLLTSTEEFTKINLERVDPKDCFRHLKGVSAGSLVNMAPVKPVMVLNREDKRIISASAVIDGIDDTTNLAQMDWQEFEVLVRDLIQREFSRDGCKVEVTRASRDAGVDAIAFDDDAIRGGKFVIQAKRYNNLVPVSAVRDLYGTVMNEGAVKGILITTSYYGKDSMEFAKNKPLTLINGEQLIYMFNKHGFDVKIELVKKQRANSSVIY